MSVFMITATALKFSTNWTKPICILIYWFHPKSTSLTSSTIQPSPESVFPRIVCVLIAQNHNQFPDIIELFFPKWSLPILYSDLLSRRRLFCLALIKCPPGGRSSPGPTPEPHEYAARFRPTQSAIVLGSGRMSWPDRSLQRTWRGAKKKRASFAALACVWRDCSSTSSGGSIWHKSGN